MTEFVSFMNPITGKLDIKLQREDYDSQQEIARAAFADMLHDTERNKKYDLALQVAVKKMKSAGREVRVLDIGTGTGLLAMMAVRAGADTVFACEAFAPMAECARKVIADNDMAGRILLCGKRSTELVVGEDLPTKANVLVTEVFDTELIGEGAISTFNHAHRHLLEEDCIVIPSAANVYAQVVCSPFLASHNCIGRVTIGSAGPLTVPPGMADCPGTPSLHDLQLTQLDQSRFTELTRPFKIFGFDFGSCGEIARRGETHAQQKSCGCGRADAIFTWWELLMDQDGGILLSCAPVWARSHLAEEKLPWRDHWMQAVYYPMQPVNLQEDQAFTVHAFHDEYSLWFSLSGEPLGPSACRCGLHLACSRARLAMLNSPGIQEKYRSAVDEVLQQSAGRQVLCIGDGSLLPFYAASSASPCGKVFTLESKAELHSIMSQIIEVNKEKCRHDVVLLSGAVEELTLADFGHEKIGAVIAEPFFSQSLLPWENILFWYTRSCLASVLCDGAAVMPVGATLRAIAVDFVDLWKIRAPVGHCEGLDLSQFDELIERACDMTDSTVESQPLWEYPGYPLSAVIDLLHFDFTQPLEGDRVVEKKGCINFNTSGRCCGIAIWMDFHLTKHQTVSSGLVATPPKLGEALQWEHSCRQGVHLVKNVHNVTPSNKLMYNVSFRSSSGEFEFNFTVD